MARMEAEVGWHMAEIDWDKIIKEAQSRKAEQQKQRDLEKRERDIERREADLEKRMEKIERVIGKKMLDGADESVEDKSYLLGARPKEVKPPVNVKFHPERLGGLGQRISNSISGLASGVSGKIGSLGKDRYKTGSYAKRKGSGSGRKDRDVGGPAGTAGSPNPLQMDFWRSNGPAMFVVILIAAIAITMHFSDGADPISNVVNLKWTGLTINSAPVTNYVCADGVTVVNDTQYCPTTTTTTTTTTTLPPTTTSTTTTTTTIVEADHTVRIVSATCKSNIVTAVVKNAGSTTDNSAYINFYVDGKAADTFLCPGGSILPGGTVTCSSGMLSDGSHTIEARGLVNVDKAKVQC